MAIGRFEGQSPFSITDIDPNDLLRAYGDLSPALFQRMITEGIGPIEIAWDVLTKKKGQQSSEGIETFQGFNNRFGDDQGLTENELTEYAEQIVNGADGGNVAREIIANTSQEVGKIQSAFDKDEKVRNFAAAANEIYPNLSLIPLDKFIEMYPGEAEQLRISLEQEGLTFNDIKPYLDNNVNEASGKFDREATSEEFNNVFNVNGGSGDALIAETVSGGDSPQQTGPPVGDSITQTFLNTDGTEDGTGDPSGTFADKPVHGPTGQPTGQPRTPISLGQIFSSSDLTTLDEITGLPPIVSLSLANQFLMVARDKLGPMMSRSGMSERVSSFSDVSLGGFILDKLMEYEIYDVLGNFTAPEEYYYEWVDRAFTIPKQEFQSDEYNERKNKNYSKLIEAGKNMDNQAVSSDLTSEIWEIANNTNYVFAAIKAFANITGGGLHGQQEERAFNRLAQEYQQERGFNRTNLGPAAWFAEKVGGPRFTVQKPESVKLTQQGPVKSLLQSAVAAGGAVKKVESQHAYQTGRTDPPSGWGFPDKDSAYKAPPITLPPQYNEALYRIGDKGFSIQGMGGTIQNDWVAIGFR
jgi:hypothetical protein